jgi:hypothetical protein
MYTKPISYILVIMFFISIALTVGVFVTPKSAFADRGVTPNSNWYICYCGQDLPCGTCPPVGGRNQLKNQTWECLCDGTPEHMCSSCSAVVSWRCLPCEG